MGMSFLLFNKLITNDTWQNRYVSPFVRNMHGIYGQAI
jgi:hypothetical protein